MTTERRTERAPGRVGSDLHHGLIVGLGIGAVVMTTVALLSVLGLTDYFAVRRAPQSVAARIDPNQIPPPPRLQHDPPADLHALRARKRVLLDSYGWVDRQAGIVRIPIERAMALLVERQQGRKP